MHLSLSKPQQGTSLAQWISSTEAALYVHTEQQHWTSHHEVPLFQSRPLYLIWECKRILSSNKAIITRADTATHFSQITYEFQPTATAGDGSHLAAKSKSSTVVSDGIQLASLSLTDVDFLNARCVAVVASLRRCIAAASFFNVCFLCSAMCIATAGFAQKYQIAVWP